VKVEAVKAPEQLHVEEDEGAGVLLHREVPRLDEGRGEVPEGEERHVLRTTTAVIILHLPSGVAAEERHGDDLRPG
jgi:hypothetical protein